MNGHLVTVKVRVESRANHGVQGDGVPLHQARAKRLHTESMESGGAIQHDRVFTDHFSERVPYLFTILFHP